MVQGVVDVSRRGLLGGPGAGVGGSGGSYGGSGGMLRHVCSAAAAAAAAASSSQNLYFSIYANQIGSLDVGLEVTGAAATSGAGAGAGMGSGGGAAGGGQGGGLILLQASTVDIRGGQLLSAGGDSSVSSVGSGSGGGVAIIASRSFQYERAEVSVRGGRAVDSWDIAGGGGGRVSVTAPRPLDMSFVVRLQGGADSGSGEFSCLSGAAGTMLWTDTSSPSTSTSMSLLIHNNNMPATGLGRSVTLLTESAILSALQLTLISGSAAVGTVNLIAAKNFVEISQQSALVGYVSVMVPTTTSTIATSTSPSTSTSSSSGVASGDDELGDSDKSKRTAMCAPLTCCLVLS